MSKETVPTVNLRPLNDYVLIKPKKEEKTASGLHLVKSAHDPPVEGVVVAVGPGRMLENGNRVKPEVEVGSKVVYAKHVGTEIEVDGVKYQMMKEDCILAVTV